MIKKSYLFLFSFLFFIFLSCYFVNHKEDLDLFNSKHNSSSSQSSLVNHKNLFSQNQHKEETTSTSGATDTTSATTTTADATTTATTSENSTTTSSTDANTTTNSTDNSTNTTTNSTDNSTNTTTTSDTTATASDANTTTSSSDNTTNTTDTNATVENFTFIWTGLVYSLEMGEAIINADLILNITSPYNVTFYAKSLSNGSFYNSDNLTMNLTYNGSLYISAAGFEDYNQNFSFNSSLLTTLDFGQINMSYKWPTAAYTRNLTGQALAEYNCNQSISILGVNASIKIMIMNSNGNVKSYEYPKSSTRTNINGDFSTSLPVFESITGKLSSYNYEIIITPDDPRILTYEEELTMNGNEWQSPIYLGKILLDENVEGDEGLPCPY